MAKPCLSNAQTQEYSRLLYDIILHILVSDELFYMNNLKGISLPRALKMLNLLSPPKKNLYQIFTVIMDKVYYKIVRIHFEKSFQTFGNLLGIIN